MGPRLLRPAVLALATAAALPASAAAAPTTWSTLDLLGGTQSITAPTAVARSCFARPLAAGTAGVTLKHLTTSIDGYVDARLHGSPTGADWDLAVFNAVTGKLVGASAAFGGNEVVQAVVPGGTPLTIQACHYDGEQSSVPLTVSEEVADGPLPKPVVESLVRVAISSQAQADKLLADGFDTNETSLGRYVDVVAHGPADLAKLTTDGFTYKVRVADLAKSDAETLRSDALASKVKRTAVSANLPSGRTTYRELDDYEMDLKNLVAAHPTEVQKVVLPHLSVEGRTIEGVQIATDVAAKDDGRPVVFQLGLHHVREWPSGEMPMEYALDLFKSYGPADAARKQRILDGERQYVIPVINPDGLVATQLTGADDPLENQPNATLAMSLAGTGAYRRKNCSNGVTVTTASSTPDMTPCSAEPGVDLNRNYGAFWGGPGESDNNAMQDFRGPAPYSEPESQNIHDLSSGLQVMVVNSNHTFAGDVLYQPGFHRSDEPGLKTTDIVPYSKQMKALSDAIAGAAGYLSEVSYLLYDVTGATEDWNYFAQGAFGYTTETSYDNFHPDYQDGVIDQYTGTIAGDLDKAATNPVRKPSDGLRESMLLTAEAGLNQADHSTLVGYAPPGRILRLQKKFDTSTSNVETQTDTADMVGSPLEIPEHLDTTLTVPASGKYTWAIDPSTRPVMILAGKTESWTMTCEDTAGHVLETHQVTIAINQTQGQSFACGTSGVTGATGTTQSVPDATTGPSGQTGPTGTTPITTMPTTTTASTTTGSTTTPPPTTAVTSSVPVGPPPPLGTTTTLASTTTTITTPAPTTPVLTGSRRLTISRPAFSAKRTKRVGKIQVRLLLHGGGTLRGVKVSILNAKGQTLFTGRIAALTGSKNVKLTPTPRGRKLAVGKVKVLVTASDAGKATKLTKAAAVKR